MGKMLFSVHVQPSIGATGLTLGLSLFPYYACTSSEGSGKIMVMIKP